MTNHGRLRPYHRQKIVDLENEFHRETAGFSDKLTGLAGGVWLHQEAHNIPALRLNAFWEPLEFEPPLLKGGGRWRRWIDTALASPHDIIPWQESPAFSGMTYLAAFRPEVVFFAGAGH